MSDKMNITLTMPIPSGPTLTLRNYTSYAFSSALYDLADMAEITVPYTETEIIEPGYQIQAKVSAAGADTGGELVFAGTVDAITHEYNKTAHNVTLRCRDYSSFLVDEYCSVLKDYTLGTGLTIYNDLVNAISAVKFKDLKTVDMKPLFRLSSEKDLLAHILSTVHPFKVEPGDTVAGKLQELAVRMGVDFLYLEDGEVIFGKLDDHRAKEKLQGIRTNKIYNTQVDKNVIIKSCSYVNDLSGRYSKIRVFGQAQQGQTFFSTTYDNSLLWNKFMIVNFNDLEESLVKRGVEIREEQREAAFELEYNVVGHTQSGQAWQINREVNVKDDIIGLRDNFIVNSRSMTYGPTSGTETYLRLGLIKDYTNDTEPPPTGNSWNLTG